MTEMHPADRVYRNTTVRLSDLTVIDDVVRAVTFERCVLEGPAVVALIDGTDLRGVSLEGDPDSAFWVIPDTQQRVVGAIALSGCTLVGCNLRRVGIVVPQARLEDFRRGFGVY